MHLHFQPTSLYYQPFQHPPIFTAKERESIFRHALPEYFPSDFARAMLDVDLNVTLLQEMLPWLLEKQVQTLDQRWTRRIQHQQQQQQYPYGNTNQMMQNPSTPFDSYYPNSPHRSFVSSNHPNHHPSDPQQYLNNNDNNDQQFNMRSFLSSSFVNTPTRPRSPNDLYMDPQTGSPAMRPMGEEDTSHHLNDTYNNNNNNNSTVNGIMLPGGLMYREDDTMVLDDDADVDVGSTRPQPSQHTQQPPTSASGRLAVSSKRSVSFLQDVSIASSTNAPVATSENVTGGVPASGGPIASGGGRIAHDKVVNYMVASGKDPTRYSGNGAVWY